MKDFKNYLFYLLFLLFLFAGYDNAYAVGGSNTAEIAENAAKPKPIHVTVDNKYIGFDVSPQIINGRTMVPLRAIFEALGSTVEWDERIRTVIGIKDEITVMLKIDDTKATVNGKEVILDSPGVIVNGRTLVPVRFIAESLGSKVDWDSKTSTVIIISREMFQFSSDTIKFKDPNLEKAIRDHIGKHDGSITLADVQSIITFNAGKREISDLTGIENLKNLRELYLYSNSIKNIDNLKDMKNLQVLDLWGNRIQNIESIGNLDNIKALDLAYNQIIDISPLKNLVNIEQLNLYYNPIVDISVLKSLEKLYVFYFESYNAIVQVNDNLLKRYEVLNQKVENILSTVINADMTELEKEIALHDYIVLNTMYDSENYEKNSVPEVSHSHYGVFINGVAVCDGYAKALHILLSKAGIECEIIEGEGAEENQWINHAWNLAKIEGKYYHVDATYNDPNFIIFKDGKEQSKKALKHNYFNLSDAQMCASHKWNRELYQKCETDNDYVTFRRDNRFLSDGEWIYSNLFGKLHRIKADGTDITIISEDDARYMEMDSEWIYYSNWSDERQLYRIKKDGSAKEKINNDTAAFIRVVDKNIYYINSKDNSLMMLKSGVQGIPVLKYDPEAYMRIAEPGKSIYKDDFYVWWMDIYNDTIYYTCFSWNDKNRLYNKALKNLDIIYEGEFGLYNVNQECLYETNRFMIAGFDYYNDGRSIKYSYNEIVFIVDGWIYYIRDGEEKSINRIKTDASENITIYNGNCSDIEIVGDWVYYISSSDNKYYRIKSDGTDNICLE